MIVVKDLLLFSGLVLFLMNGFFAFPVFYEQPFHEDDIGASPWAADSHGGFTNEEYGAMRLVRGLSSPENQAFESEDSLATGYSDQNINSVHSDNDPLVGEEDAQTGQAHQNSGSSEDSGLRDSVDAGIIQELANQRHETSEVIAVPSSHFVEQSFTNVDPLKRNERDASKNTNSETLNAEKKGIKQIEKKSDNSHDVTNNNNVKNQKGEAKNPEKVGLLKTSDPNTASPEGNRKLVSEVKGKDAKDLTPETKSETTSNSEDKRKSRSAESDSYHWEPAEEDRKSWVMNTGNNNEQMPIVNSELEMVNDVPDDGNVQEREMFDDGSIDNNVWIMSQESYEDSPDSSFADGSRSNNNIRSRSISDDTLQLLLDEKANRLRENNAKQIKVQVPEKETKEKHVAKEREIKSADYETTTEFTTLPPSRIAKSLVPVNNQYENQPMSRNLDNSNKKIDENRPDKSKTSSSWKIFHLLEPPREETLDIFIGSGKKKRSKAITILLPESQYMTEQKNKEGLLLKTVASTVGAALCSKDPNPCVTVDKRNVGRLLGALLLPLVNEEPDNWRVRVHSDYAVNDAIEDLLDRLERDRSGDVELVEGNAVVQKEKMMPLPVIKGDLIEELPLAANGLEKIQTKSEKRKRDALSKDKRSNAENLLDLEELKDISDEPAKIRVKRD